VRKKRKFLKKTFVILPAIIILVVGKLLILAEILFDSILGNLYISQANVSFNLT
jgi:hypothetical protein